MTTTLDAGMYAAASASLIEAQAEVKRIAGTFKHEDGNFVIPTEQHADYVTAVRKAKEAKAFVDAIDESRDIDAYLDGVEGKSAAGQHFGQRGTRGADDYATLADVLIESKSYKQLAESMDSGLRNFERLRADHEGKSIFNFAYGTHTTQALGTVQDVGIAEMAYRKWHVRDLFPKSTTKAAILTGLRETGWVNNASQIPQRTAADGVSPATGGASDVYPRAKRSQLHMEPTTFVIAEIAHLLDAHKNILADEPRLRTFINTRLIEGVKYTEDWDLLHSPGGGEKITGLFETPGIQEYTGNASDKWSVQVRRAITKALLAEYDPSGLVVSPSRFEELELETDDTGAFRIAVNAQIGAEKKLWRLNVVETTAMADSTYLIGAFGLGAQLHDRESVSVTVSSENSDNYEKGIVTFRCDERLALEVVRPESFVVGTWVDPV